MCCSRIPEGTTAYNQQWLITSDGKAICILEMWQYLKSSSALNKRELKFKEKWDMQVRACWRWPVEAHLQAIGSNFWKPFLTKSSIHYSHDTENLHVLKEVGTYQQFMRSVFVHEKCSRSLSTVAVIILNWDKKLELLSKWCLYHPSANNSTDQENALELKWNLRQNIVIFYGPQLMINFIIY